jgi:glucose-6-phosphate dehydrogenase assembly protein OpcA
VSDDVWEETDTTPDAIDHALRVMLRERHAENETLAPARVLNLVVIVDREWKGEIANRLADVGRYHASRTVLCSVEQGRTTLDARATISYEDPSGSVSVMLEQIEIDLGPEHLERLDSIVDPVIVSALPTVLWSPHGHDQAVDSVLGIVDVILIDSDDTDETSSGLERAEDLLESVYIVDLAWLRTTPWRERLAASFDLRDRIGCLSRLAAVTVRHRPSSTATALLLVGWLAARLNWEASALSENGSRSLQGAALRQREAEDQGEEITIELDPADQQAPGLAGVSVSTGEDFTLSLDRASGGLCAKQRSGGEERVWQVLGASRGEGGILGEGVRQALLRDPTYGPALGAARRFCPA